MKLRFKKELLALLLVLVLPVFAACDVNKSEDEATDKEEKTTEENKDKDTEKDTKEDEAKDSEKENKTDTDSENKDTDNSEEEPEAELGVFEGNIPYDFELVSFQDGKTYKLSDYLGKQPIVIKFFASWCGPCRMEMPELEGVYQDYQEAGLMVFAVNLGAGDSEEEVEQIISDYLLTYPVLKDEMSDVATKYGITSIPVNIFVGKDGLIKNHVVGMQSRETYEENVESILDTE